MKQRPATPTHSEEHPFLPTQPVAGYRGFYPADRDQALDLPLPIRQCSVQEKVVGIEVQMMFRAVLTDGDASFNHCRVVLPAHEVLRHLFYRTGVTVKVQRVVWRDGAKSWAKWWQDSRTGAFCLVSGHHNYGPEAGARGVVAMQGGYRGHMPGGIEWRDDFGWNLDSRNRRHEDERGTVWRTVGM